MGLFKGTEKAIADSVYESSKKHLVPKDSQLHMVFYYLSGNIVSTITSCEDKLSAQVNQIVGGMQNDGYEIIDVRTMPIFEQASMTINKRQIYLLQISYR